MRPVTRNSKLEQRPQLHLGPLAADRGHRADAEPVVVVFGIETEPVGPSVAIADNETLLVIDKTVFEDVGQVANLSYCNRRMLSAEGASPDFGDGTLSRR